MFNVLNKDEIMLGGGVKPILEEKGPYVFREKLIRSKVTFSDDGNLVSYTNMKQQKFVLDEDYLVFEDDDITLPSISYTKAVFMASDYGLTGDEYLFTHEVSKYFGKMKTKYQTSSNTLYNGGLFGNEFDFNVPDYLWRKFLPEIMYDMYDYIHENPSD